MGMLLSCEHKEQSMKEAVRKGLEQRLEQASIWIKEKDERLQLD